MDTYNEKPKDDFVVIDVEYADHDQYICQFGLAEVKGGVVQQPHTWKIRPKDNRYGAGQTAIHHMTPADTEDSPTLPEVWPEIEPYLRGRQLWAHNATSTERRVIEKNLTDYYHIPHEPLVINESILLFPRPCMKSWNDGRGLQACCYALGIPYENHHDAGADSVMCAQAIIAWQQGRQPDWELSNRMMAEYDRKKREAENEKNRHYQAQQLDLFAEALASTSSSSGDDGAVEPAPAPTFYNKQFDKSEDGTDDVDYSSLNTADTNPIYGAAVVLTGFFHIGRKQLREALKEMGADLKPAITKNIQVVIRGERNVGPAKIKELDTLIHNGYNIARICGDADLDRLLYDRSLTPADFNVPPPARKDLNFTVAHYRKHRHELQYPVNTIAGKELYFPPTGLMGRMDCFCQICGNLGAFGNWDYNPQVNLVVLPVSSMEALQRGEKDNVIRAFEDYYNSQRSVTFNAEFITERDILKFARERIVRCDDDVTCDLYVRYLESAGIDSEKDFKYGLAAARDAFKKENQKG